ncbi:MAG TPA: virulence factor, partial [Thiolinea sp.]|nr:virulence factor [Thiolinea sp.]
MPQKIIVYWRDIPSQVTIQQGRTKGKWLMSQRFQEAIDRAAIRAGKADTDSYVAEWRRETSDYACDGELEACARAEVALLDLPQLTEDQPAHRPFAAAYAVPWPGEMAVFRSPSTDGFELLTTFGGRARIGTLVSDFFAGPTSRFDLGNALVVDLLTGALESVTELTL